MSTGAANDDAATPTVWAVVLDDVEYQVQDLAVGVLARIAKEEQVIWTIVVDAPLSDLAVAERVVRSVAAANGATVPEVITARDLLPYFKLVADDVPQPREVKSDSPLSAGAGASTDG